MWLKRVPYKGSRSHIYQRRPISSAGVREREKERERERRRERELGRGKGRTLLLVPRDQGSHPSLRASSTVHARPRSSCTLCVRRVLIKYYEFIDTNSI